MSAAVNHDRNKVPKINESGFDRFGARFNGFTSVTGMPEAPRDNFMAGVVFWD
jgi:hypothetical protein